MHQLLNRAKTDERAKALGVTSHDLTLMGSTGCQLLQLELLMQPLQVCVCGCMRVGLCVWGGGACACAFLCFCTRVSHASYFRCFSTQVLPPPSPPILPHTPFHPLQPPPHPPHPPSSLTGTDNIQSATLAGVMACKNEAMQCISMILNIRKHLEVLQTLKRFKEDIAASKISKNVDMLSFTPSATATPPLALQLVMLRGCCCVFRVMLLMIVFACFVFCCCYASLCYRSASKCSPYP